MEAQKTYDHHSLNTPSNGYTNTSNRSSFAYSFHFKTHTAPRQIPYMLKQRDIQEQQLQQQQSETSSMQTSLLFLFIPLNRNEAIHTTLKWDPHQHDDDQMCKHGPSDLLFCISPKEQSFIGEWLWWELHSFMFSSPQEPNCLKRKRNV